MTEPYIYYEDEFIQLWCGDVRSVLPLLPAGIAQTCITSPPYFGLRDYGVDGQLGLESTPAAFLETMTDVFDQVRRVLRPGSTLWCNMGDSYASNWPCNRRNVIGTGSLENGKRENRPPRGIGDGIKDKDLMMIPAELAITLRNAGWWLRSEIIWAKPNPMPESVTDRPTKSHEQVYLLANAQKYFYDAEAIKENTTGNAHARGNGVNPKAAEPGSGIRQNTSFSAAVNEIVSSRNARTVWTIAPQPFSEAHFATFPPELPERCIKAGTSAHGQCVACGDPYTRIIEKQPYTADKMPDGWDTGPGRHEAFHREGREKGKGRDRTAANRNGEGQSTLDNGSVLQTATIGWQKTCKCETDEVEPQIVLEPFAGAGTTLIAAKKLGRRSIGIELNPDYCKIIVARIQKETAMPLFDA